ncbi:Dual specificity kinase 1 [Mycena chlorophos]|uniref:Dual specificity kinase 1 n=1 Tax=Mycena chlorophos TaxID=658473 RepID=A0A8H6S3B9_MYCCL|nr:Dual specificity kinase 1 [Mycena chlorophos]
MARATQQDLGAKSFTGSRSQLFHTAVMSSSTSADLIVSSGKASLSVLLVVIYGFLLRKLNFISAEGEANIAQLCTKFFLPALLFTEIGPLATARNLGSYYPIIPLSLFFQGVALTVAVLSRMFGMPQHLVPMFVFNNVTSLPLLLLGALAATGGLDSLVTPERPLAAIVKTGQVYILINALVGNLTRFALGPYLMKAHEPDAWTNDGLEDDRLLPEGGRISLPETETPGSHPPRHYIRTTVHLGIKAVRALNPPLIGGLLALVFGLVPWFHTQLFGSGILSPVADSINTIGKLFGASQMLVLGASLYSKKGSPVHPFVLTWLFTYRFVFAPALSIGVIYYISTRWPSFLGPDPMLRYVMCLSNVGPPALTLSAVAVMAQLPQDEDAQVSRILTFSYALSPLIAFPQGGDLRRPRPQLNWVVTMGDQIPRYLANYYLADALGSGYSGSIFRATNIHSGDVVALKVQHVNHECPTNRYERGFYPSLQGGVGMPTLWAGGVEGQWDYLAIDLLGPSLDNLFRKSGKDTMELSAVCALAMQLIARLEFMHSRGILHRDIQLGNCVIGLPPYEKIIYMIDFGFSKRYIDPYTNRHIPDSKAKRQAKLVCRFTRCPNRLKKRFYWKLLVLVRRGSIEPFYGHSEPLSSSIGVHCRGKVPSRRDDLEAAALMLIHLLTPRGLPWTRNGVPKTDDAHERLKKEKKAARPEDLCRGLPPEFEEFLRYCRGLQFMECPDYERWIEAFRELAVDSGFPEDDDFIWPPVPANIQPRAGPRRSLAPPPDEMARILNDLTNLNLGEPALGDQATVDEAVRKAKQAARDESDDSAKDAREVIDITTDSDDDHDTIPPPHLTPKAYKLLKLVKRVEDATENTALSECILEFVGILKSNSSRTLTKEGFAFIDALYKQLADPSVFLLPMRTSKTRSSDKSIQQEKEPAHVKLGIVAGLRQEVQMARSNKELAQMVEKFGSVTNKSTGRTVTKDGFAFLEGMAKRLQILR